MFCMTHELRTVFKGLWKEEKNMEEEEEEQEEEEEGESTEDICHI